MMLPEADGGASDRGSVTLSSSARVRLEVAILAADHAAPETLDVGVRQPAGRTVLMVAAEADVRWYVRECLRERPDIRVIEAASVREAVQRAERDAPHLILADGPEADVVVSLPEFRAIVITDEAVAADAPPNARVTLLARPFSATALVAAVDGLLDVLRDRLPG